MASANDGNDGNDYNSNNNNTVVAGDVGDDVGDDGYTSNNTGISEKQNKDRIYTITMIPPYILKIKKKDTGFFIECEYLPATTRLQCKKKMREDQLVRAVHINAEKIAMWVPKNSVGENPVKYLFNVFDKDPKGLYNFFDTYPKMGGRRRTKRRKHTTKKTRRRHH
jgi:hypothetical protein